jgi:hypothetical protein
VTKEAENIHCVKSVTRKQLVETVIDCEGFSLCVSVSCKMRRLVTVLYYLQFTVVCIMCQ